MTDLANKIGFNPQNLEPRCPCLLLLDTSGSMAGSAIAELNAGIQQFRDEITEDSVASLRTETAILTFSDRTNLVQDFATMDQFQPPVLIADGSTCMAAALLQGLQLIEERKKVYKAHGVPYYRPWLMLITDGAPTDPASDVEHARQQLEAAQNNHQLSFFAIGVAGADLDFLRRLSGPARPPLKLKGMMFKEFFRWLSGSMSRVSASRIGDKVPLPPPGWGEAAA